MVPEHGPGREGGAQESLLRQLPEIVRSAAAHVVGIVMTSESTLKTAITSPVEGIDIVKDAIGKLKSAGENHMISPSIVLAEIQRRFRGDTPDDSK